MKLSIFLIVAIFLSGCSTSGYQQFYEPYVEAKTIPEVRLLANGQEPQIFGTDNFDRDTQILRSKKYVPVGHSSFNGSYEDTKNAATQAKLLGASLVLVSSQYTNTQTTTSPLFLSNNTTTYHSGYVDGASFNGTSTSYGSQVVPITSHQRRYDQTAVYFAETTHEYKLGVLFHDLTPDQRAAFARNTGVFIDVIIEDSPAFHSNILVGDVLIAVNGHTVINSDHAMEVMPNVIPGKKTAKLTVIRNGTPKVVEVVL